MATPITKSVGTTGRDYSTLTAFEAAMTADLVTADETWTGECYNDSEFSERLTVDGHTTDSTRWIKVTTATGESFMDHADKLTNALAYDQSKGVGITNTGGYQHTVELKDGYITFEKIQIKRPSGGGNNSALHNDVSNVTAQNLIIHQLDNATAARIQGSSKLINSVVITEATSVASVLLVLGGSAYNVTSVSPSDITNTSNGFQRSYGSPVALNCASFGFNGGFGGYASFSGSSGYNATDDANAPGSNNQVSKTFSSQFETVATTGMDFRAKSGSDLESNGTRDQANTADLDIIGQDRSITTPTIGAWEFIAAGGDTALIIQDSTHAHSADNLALTQQNTLAVQDAAHAHSADNVVLTGVDIDLIIQESSHAHAADNLDLVQANVLTVQDSTHAHLAENVALTQQNQLVIADALHAHAADNLTLSLSTLLIVQDGAHAHTADNLGLTQANVLAIADALHALSSDNVDLTQQNTLVIDDALHALISDNVTITIPGTAVTPIERTYIIQKESRTYIVMRENRTSIIH